MLGGRGEVTDEMGVQKKGGGSGSPDPPLWTRLCYTRFTNIVTLERSYEVKIQQ